MGNVIMIGDMASVLVTIWLVDYVYSTVHVLQHNTIIKVYKK